METLLYISRARDGLTNDDVARILEASRRNNPKMDITGLLLHGNGTFLQVLQGPEAAVELTYQRIVRDPRHYDVTVIDRTDLVERFHPDWSMGSRAFPDAGDAVALCGDALRRKLESAETSCMMDFVRGFYDREMGPDAPPSAPPHAAMG